MATNALAPDSQNALALFNNAANYMDANQKYGPRMGGAQGMKGLGYFGAIPRPDGSYSTELSAEMNGIHFPLMVPTLSKEELDHLLSGGKPTDAIYQKAYSHALMRGQSGLDPFATNADLPVSVPQ